MPLSQVLQILRDEGFRPSRGRIRSALINGHLKPPPVKVGRGAYRYEYHHLEQLRWYMTHVKPGPKPAILPDLKIEGRYDRIRRLEEEKARRAVKETHRAGVDKMFDDIEKLWPNSCLEG